MKGKILPYLMMITMLWACRETTTKPNQEIVVIDTFAPVVLSEEEIKEQERLRQEEEDFLDTIAIGNIHLNTTKDVFETEKAQFLKENGSLGSLRIESIIGLFWNNRLAAVQLISEDNSFYRENMKDNNTLTNSDPLYWEVYGEGTGWCGLYKMKYKDYYLKQSNGFGFEYVKGRKGIHVTDYCSSNKPYSSFDKLIKESLPTGWHGKGLYSPKQFHDSRNAFGGENVMLAVENWSSVTDVFKDLPTNRAKQLEAMLGINPNYRDCQRIYDIAIQEANVIIQRENEIGYNKHKNDPSYSVIIIGFIPAFEEFEEFDREQRNSAKKKLQEELDII